MKITELTEGQGDVEIEATVEALSETREFNKFGKQLKVATATIKDDSGSIDLSLWNEDIDKIKVGNQIKITNGFVKEFQGTKQITTGKMGTIEVVGADAAPSEAPSEAEPAEAAPAEESAE